MIAGNIGISNKQAKRSYKRCFKAFNRLKYDASKSGLKLIKGFDDAGKKQLDCFKRNPYKGFEDRFLSDTKELRIILKDIIDSGDISGLCPFEKTN